MGDDSIRIELAGGAVERAARKKATKVIHICALGKFQARRSLCGTVQQCLLQLAS